MSEDDRAKVAQLENAALNLDDAIRRKEKDLKIASDRRQKQGMLHTEVSQVEKDVTAISKNVSAMNAEVTDFPTDTQVLKLERRVQHLREQVKESDKNKQQHKTGIEAYVSRQSDNLAGRERLIATLLADLNQLTEAVGAEMEKESHVTSSSGATEGILKVVEISDDRERDVEAQIQELSRTSQRDQELTVAIVDAQSRAEREGPAIDVRCDDMLQRITDAWEKEKFALQQAYDKLFVINKEHRYHLTRGTHVKRTVTSASHEAALSNRHGHLAAQLVELQGRLYQAVEENKHTRRLIDKVKESGRISSAKFDADRIEAQQRLGVAREAHNRTLEEGYRFRSLKGELQNVLHTVREASPSSK